MQTAVFPLGPLQTNCFVIHSAESAVIVDPGGEPESVLRYCTEKKLIVERILCTHLHFDHTYGAAELARRTKASVFASEKDRYMLQNELGLGGMWGLPAVEPYEFIALSSGPQVFAGSPCTVLETPGHTPGGLSFYFPELKAVFAGDTLFHRSVGRTDFPGGSSETLHRSIREQLYTLPDDTTVYSGHGEPTNVGDEKRNNPHVSDFSGL